MKKYNNPLSLKVTFKFSIENKFLFKILDTQKTTLFDKIEIINVNRKTATINYSIMKPIQNTSYKKTDTFIVIERKIRNDFFKRINFCKKNIIDFKSELIIKYISRYNPK